MKSAARSVTVVGCALLIGVIVFRARSTETLTTHVQDAYESFDLTGAYAGSVLLASLAILTLVAMSVLKPKEGIDGDRGT